VPNFIDLTGQKFGRLTVIQQAPNYKKFVCWFCRCCCGNELVVRACNLFSSHTKSCGCLKREKAAISCSARKLDLTGRRFGRLTALRPAAEQLERVGDRPRTRTRWFCECDCGGNKIVTTRELVIGHTKSCGCLAKESRASRFGEKSPAWRGGKYKGVGGYIKVLKEDRRGQRQKYEPEHVAVMAKHIGRPLLPNETVHHKNGIRDDNRLENLELWCSMHPFGQRVTDLVAFAVATLEQYAPERLTAELHLPSQPLPEWVTLETTPAGVN